MIGSSTINTKYMTKTRTEAMNFFAQKQNTKLSFSFIFSSGKPGPKIVIIGGVHGNEPVGVEAIIKIQEEMQNLKNGEIAFILGDPMAYLEDVRFISSNLNRCFVKPHPKDYEGFRAKEITDFLRKYKPDYLLDLHSVSIGDTQMEIHKNKNNIVQCLINRSFMQIVVSEKAMKGSSIQLKFIENTMGVECGNHNSSTGLSVAIFKIKQLLNYFKMAEFSLEKTQSCDNFVAYELIEPIIPRLGFEFTNPDIASEIFVKKGEVYAKSKNGDIIASGDSYILMPCPNPKITDTDAGFLAKKIVFLIS